MLKSQLELFEVGIKEISANEETLKKNLLELIELRHVLTKAETFFVDVEHFVATGGTEDEAETMMLPSYPRLSGNKASLTFMAGVIPLERLHRFELVLWRSCHAKVFIKYTPIMTPLEDPTTGAMVQKNVFVLFFQGEQLRARVRKICDGFKATLYHCPERAHERREMAQALSSRIDEYEEVLHHTQDQRVGQLYKISHDVGGWLTEVLKTKMIYNTLDMCNYDMTQKCLVAECWCPVKSLGDIQEALRNGTEYSGAETLSIVNRMHTSEAPPTYFKTSKFTSGFQAIVDAYGIASYREVNPTPYTIITFPFLFAVMFGDAGHGLIMMLTAVFMIWRERQLKYFKDFGEMFDMIFNGRYLILMMGIFSIYTGLIYNDVFSKSINLFGSQWDVSYNHTITAPKIIFFEISGNVPTTVLPAEAMQRKNPYPFGVDPIWQFSDNKLVFLNSMKMKLSIIFGVMHMIFGTVLSTFNYRHFKQRYSIWAEFVPQLIFISSIFGYMVLLILIKWCSYYDSKHISEAPNILTTSINMFISPHQNITSPLLFSEGVQQSFQILLVWLAMVCIPWMLFAKPWYLRRKYLKRHRHHYGVVRYNKEEGIPLIETNSTGGEPVQEKFDFGEVMIKQAIHTIEYCLGCISNTASYLRLWALSLAHAQLSEVLWTMILRPLAFIKHADGFLSFANFTNTIVLFSSFAVWAVLTVSILIVMEGLSAFLHALRLHWVEFQSKFYSGEGYVFVPFTFDIATNDVNE
ncbi:V-type proton ATPase 116 kDa subunit a 1-like isoform X2 [Dysidea avara]|uniref:V-type proton ATPase 116 kDa subunit a 1-like isoform X2 n=1 Tax=Dysidea avara TaxID=196820 RepID=UPI00331B4E4E